MLGPPSSIPALENQGGSIKPAPGYFPVTHPIKPEYPKAQNDLAWVLATSPQASLRNGNEAVELAQQVEQADRRLYGYEYEDNPNRLRTLAAAYAEAGRFGDARRSAQKAIELARAAHRPEMVELLNGELKLYEAGIPFHQGSK
jgi:Flp pilus assembly protein TadD